MSKNLVGYCLILISIWTNAAAAIALYRDLYGDSHIPAWLHIPSGIAAVLAASFTMLIAVSLIARRDKR
jgi:hypothetical protein